MDQFESVAIGTALVLLGLYSFIAVFVRRLRTAWRRTNVTPGSLSYAGFGIVLTIGGFAEVFGFTEHDNLLVIIPAAIGMLIGLIGFVRDFDRDFNSRNINETCDSQMQSEWWVGR